ncbi:Dihydrodipicolinate synthase [Mycena indigotica]|uniref:Dihydrodipicolinate synthase n=1 Tax=Mycena indigotica TaxID=2126181 RepID=A0A8H6TDP3_9AGAR|nr:Dihydrodipicolinate synthase [Mycena indigotica]KAF7315773.1 Dihydrodipicolinate synthase [Mycena indigotica]
MTTPNDMAPATLSRPFTAGAWCPVTTPFTPDEEVDYSALKAQVVRLAKARMGIVLLGTNGEASHLNDSERSAVIRESRAALDSNGFTHVPILAGTGTGSAKETVRLCREARDAGADFAIVIPPGYFNFAIGRDLAALKAFFYKVLDGSPIPVMIYNFPGAASGIDFNSDTLIELSEHQNCFGAKLTCAMVGKGHRLALHTQSAAYKERHPQTFFVLPGYSDILLPSLISRMSGCITGTGNVIPKTIVKLYDTAILALASNDMALLEEARALQDLVAEADWAIVKAGIQGTKYALDTYVESDIKLGGATRVPLPPTNDGVKTMLASSLKRALAFENTL